jgi:DNA-binding GntR family transcriptional regulator
MHDRNIEALVADAILEHRLLPGQHLNEVHLAKAFGMSRSAVRIALLALESEGLVKIEPNRGVFVAKPSLDEATQLFQALAVLEGGAVDLIIGADRRAQPDALAALEATQRQLVDAQAKGMHAESIRLAVAFHTQFMALAGNGFLSEAHRKLLMQYRLVTAVFRTAMDYCSLDDHHSTILNFLHERSANKLKRLIEEHWRHIVLGHAPAVAPTDLIRALKI